VRQLVKRKRQQGVNQADKPITDTDKAVETAQQLVAFETFAVVDRKPQKQCPTIRVYGDLKKRAGLGLLQLPIQKSLIFVARASPPLAPRLPLDQVIHG
jgi:hypothetical protein